MHRRIPYGKRVTEIPHLRTAVAIIFGRLTATKLYANRALDCLQASNAVDHRRLLYKKRGAQS